MLHYDSKKKILKNNNNNNDNNNNNTLKRILVLSTIKRNRSPRTLKRTPSLRILSRTPSLSTLKRTLRPFRNFRVSVFFHQKTVFGLLVMIVNRVEDGDNFSNKKCWSWKASFHATVT